MLAEVWGSGSDSSRAKETVFFSRAPFERGRGLLTSTGARVAWLRDEDEKGIQEPPETRLEGLDFADSSKMSDGRDGELRRRL